MSDVYRRGAAYVDLPPKFRDVDWCPNVCSGSEVGLMQRRKFIAGLGVADRGQGPGARTDTARQRAYEPRGDRYGTSILVGSLRPGNAPARVDRRPKSALRHLLERERYPTRTNL